MDLGFQMSRISGRERERERERERGNFVYEF